MVGVSRVSWASGHQARLTEAGRTLREVCAAQERIKTFASERERFADWVGDVSEVKTEGVSDKPRRSKEKGKARA